MKTIKNITQVQNARYKGCRQFVPTLERGLSWIRLYAMIHRMYKDGSDEKHRIREYPRAFDGRCVICTRARPHSTPIIQTDAHARNRQSGSLALFMMPEIITGDMPKPLKYHNSYGVTYRDIEEEASERFCHVAGRASK